MSGPRSGQREGRGRKARRRVFALIVAAALFPSCLATSPEQWSATLEDTRIKRDIYECQAQASDVSWRATAFGGAILPILGLFAMRTTYNDCMESRGWIKGSPAQ